MEKWIEKAMPQPGQQIYIPNDTPNKWLAGECIIKNNQTHIVIPNELGPSRIIKKWLPIPKPNTHWITWALEEPPSGIFLWIRDPEFPEHYELAWSLGTPGQIKVILPNDPSFSKITEREWQRITEPNIQN